MEKPAYYVDGIPFAEDGSLIIIIGGPSEIIKITENATNPDNVALDGATLDKQAQFVKKLAARQDKLFKHEQEVFRETNRLATEAVEKQLAYSQSVINRNQKIFEIQKNKQKNAAAAASQARIKQGIANMGNVVAAIKVGEAREKERQKAEEQHRKAERELQEAQQKLAEMKKQHEKAKGEIILLREQHSRAILNQVNSLATIGAALTPAEKTAPVFSVSGSGSIALTDTTGDDLLIKFRKALNELISQSTSIIRRTPVGFVIASIFHVSKAGEGSDRVQGQTRENFLSLTIPAQAMGLSNADELRKAAKTSSMIKIPIRGKLVVTEKQINVKVIRNPEQHSIPVIEAAYDENTGLYVHSIPGTSVGGLRLITAPVSISALTGQPPLVNPLPPLQISVNPLNNSTQTTRLTPVPVTKTTRFHDVIVVYPETAHMKPVYVMFEPEAQSIAETGRQYHPEPLTEDIDEPKGLIRVKSRTPLKTGEGMKGRWMNSVDHSIYEWNSEIGKLEIVHPPPQEPKQSLKEAGEHYNPTPTTESLTDYPGLLESRARTPVEDGKGKKFRWTDAKGETLYEWNPRTGKMETYKAGRWKTEINRSGDSVRVWVVESIIDSTTGLYGITLPENEQGKQGRTVLISPVKAPGANGLGHLLHPEGRQVVILNTGNDAPIKTPIVTVYPNPVQPDIDAQIAVPPLESNYKPLYVMFNSPYGETNARGKYSGRDFHTDKAGGPILDLDWRTTIIDREGIEKVKLHTGRFIEMADNKVMIERLEKILKGELTATDTDKRFYTHEIRELERYRALGIPDGIENKSVWNNAHTATLEDYKVNEKTQPLYTQDALRAYEEQQMRENK